MHARLRTVVILPVPRYELVEIEEEELLHDYSLRRGCVEVCVRNEEGGGSDSSRGRCVKLPWGQLLLKLNPAPHSLSNHLNEPLVLLYRTYTVLCE